METATLSALRAGAAVAPGGRDREQRPLLLVPVPKEPARDHLADALAYLISVYSESTRRSGLSVVVDARCGPWRLARQLVRRVHQVQSQDAPAENGQPGPIASLIVLRPDAFWDKRRVEHCARAHRDGQALYIPRSRLPKYVDNSQLPDELGGKYIYNHAKWIENRLKVEEFIKDATEALTELEQLRKHLLDNRSVRASDIERALNTSCDMNESTSMLVHSVTETGKELLQNIEYENRNRKFDSEFEAMSTPQDILDTIDRLENLLSSIGTKRQEIDAAWTQMERSFVDAKDLGLLEDGVASVTNWILGPAETLLNSQQKVGYDVASAEELRREHESLELQCWDTYGQYAELLHRIDSFPSNESFAHKDLQSQRDFMDFVCRSFATRLERRRNVLITSLRFFRLVSEYFDRTGEVFELLVMGNKVTDFSTAGNKLKELQEHQAHLEAIERELMMEGEKLSDILSMPVKDALGRDVPVDYTEDIANVRDILDATTARKNIFGDSIELQRLTLEQVTHISTYEDDVRQAVQWLDDLYLVLVSEHGHVGCNVQEIQTQKDEHQAFQETAKGTYNYGCQLLNASLSLRQSCKIPLEDHQALSQRLRKSWQRLLSAGQEQMTRLRVSAVFHRTVDEHCGRLQQLREEVGAAPPLEEPTSKRARVRKLVLARERLLVEVGRMVRLGRLLRTRLRESLDQDGMSASEGEDLVNAENATAVEAISGRLAEVTALAERLDMALRGAQEDCALSSSAVTPANVGPSIRRIFDGTASTTEDWSGARQAGDIECDGDGDADFITASDCTYPQSRSSSFNTASECGIHSPWWELENGPEDASKEKLVLAVGCPDLPAARSVLRPSPECPPGKIVHEVTETTHLKVQQCHTLGVSSFVLTSETVRDCKADRGENKENIAANEARHAGDKAAIDEDDEEFMRRMKEVGFEDRAAWGDYYHGFGTKNAIRSCI